MMAIETHSGPLGLVERAISRLNRIPFSLLVLVARVATFSVFFRSGLVKIQDWNAAVQLFRDEYKVPVLPPDLAATLAASMELGVSWLVLLGLFTRLSVLGYFGMILVIQLFVYPMAWPDHLQWTGFMIFILCRGPGVFSLDHLLGRALRIRTAEPNNA
jgi:putative oxidoreductase